MNISNEKRPGKQDPESLESAAQTNSSLLPGEPELDFELSEKFSAWLEPRLASLVEGLDAFVTVDSLKRDLRRR
jgi:hypothetical protein